MTTAARVHGRGMLEPVLATRPSGDSQLWVDCAYRSQEMVKALRKRGYQPRMGFQVKCSQTLNAHQVSLNQEYSQARWRVELGCGTMPNAMPVMRWIGKVRATGWMLDGYAETGADVLSQGDVCRESGSVRLCVYSGVTNGENGLICANLGR